jgi:hypothetical protein
MSKRNLAVILSAFALAGCAMNARPTVSPSRMSELWVAPVNLESRDLRYGPGGAALAPDVGERFEFVAEKATGTSPGYDVKDSKGRAWGVKLGPESRPEVMASHLLSALGYHQPTVYFVPRWTLVRDGKASVQPGGRFRLEDQKKAGEWSWRDNPFLDTQPMVGLYVIQVMVNNWDIKTANNIVYEAEDEKSPPPRRRYVVKDLGGALGKTSWPMGSTENDLIGFEQEPFIVGVEGNRVRFGFQQLMEPQLASSVTPADVRWASSLLARLSPQQWNDVFRGAGFTQAESERYISRLQQKVAEGQKISWY